MENENKEKKSLKDQFIDLMFDYKPRNKREWNKAISSWILWIVLIFFILEFRMMYHEAYNMGLQSCLNNLSIEQIKTLQNMSFDFNTTFNLTTEQVKQIYVPDPT